MSSHRFVQYRRVSASRNPRKRLKMRGYGGNKPINLFTCISQTEGVGVFPKSVLNGEWGSFVQCKNYRALCKVIANTRFQICYFYCKKCYFHIKTEEVKKRSWYKKDKDSYGSHEAYLTKKGISHFGLQFLFYFTSNNRERKQKSKFGLHNSWENHFKDSRTVYVFISNLNDYWLLSFWVLWESDVKNTNCRISRKLRPTSENLHDKKIFLLSFYV